MVKPNTAKKAPKGTVKFSLTLSEEQKAAKQAILHHPFNFIVGKAGSGKTLLACQVALDMFFKRQIDKIITWEPDADGTGTINATADKFRFTAAAVLGATFRITMISATAATAFHVSDVGSGLAAGTGEHVAA